MTATTPTPEALLRELQQVRATLPDELDYPGDWSRRERDRFDHYRARFVGLVQGIQQALASRSKPRGVLAHRMPQRDRLRAAQAAIEKELSEAPDWRSIGDARTRDQAWGRQQVLAASLAALQRGVEYFNGGPALPGPLAALLTDRCAACGHTTLAWPGPLPAIEAEIAEAERLLAEEEERLAIYVGQAQALLASHRRLLAPLEAPPAEAAP